MGKREAIWVPALTSAGRYRRLAALLCGGALLALPDTVRAAETEPKVTSETADAPAKPASVAPANGDIIITARRIRENAQKVPVSVTVLSATQIRELAINTPLDLNKVAGLGGAPIGSLGSVNFTIRGQGTAFGGQQGVIPYFAEVPNFPLTYFDLDSIQVLKGPQGTLFGQSSTGGVVLFEPKRPGAKLGADVELQLGDRGYRELQGAVNVPLAGDHLAARVAFQLRKRDGWGRAVYSDGKRPQDLNNVDNLSLRLSLVWRPTDRLENLLILAGDRLRNNGNLSPLYFSDPRFMNPAVRNLVPASVPAIAAAWQFWTGYAPPPGKTFAQLLAAAQDRQLAAGPLTMFTDYGQRNETRNRGLINQTNFDLGSGLRLRNIIGLRYSTSQGATYDQDATDLPLLDFQCRFAPRATTALSPCARVGGWPDRTLTEELQLQGKLLGGRLNFQAGAFYLSGGTRRYREDTKPFIVFGRLSGDPASTAFCASVSVAPPCAAMSRTSVRSYALFGQATYEVVRGIHLTAGYRRTWDRTRTETTAKASYLVPFNGQMIAVPIYGGTPAAGAGKVTTLVDLPSRGSYNLTADWQVNDHVLLYVAHRSGYKPGGINNTANPGTPQRTFGPETSKDVEIGAKTGWSIGGITGRLNAALYQTWYSDIQEGEIIPGTAQTVTTNLADARIRGVEVEGQIRFAPWLDVAGNLALTDAKYTKWLETSSCAAQYWRSQCTGLPGLTAIVIDHARGQLDIGGQKIGFQPDRFANTSKWQWSIRPTLRLQQWLGEDVSLGANIYARTPYVDATAVANRSKLAGVPPLPQRTVFGGTTADPYDAPGYRLVDLRADWHNVMGTRFDLGAGVTNVGNKIYRVSSASAFEIIGDVYSLVGEPRMIFVSGRYAF